MSTMMEYKGYHASVDFDAEDMIFVGKVFGIADSLNFHGTSVDELEQMFHQSIDNYLDMCAKYNKVPDREFKGSFNVRISPELHKKIALKAYDKGLSLNQCVEKAIENYVDDEKNIENTLKKCFVYCNEYPKMSLNWDRNDTLFNYNSYRESVALNREEDVINAKFA